MINIVQALFEDRGLPRNTRRSIASSRLGSIAGWTALLLASVPGAFAAGGARAAQGEIVRVAGPVIRCDPGRNPTSTDCPGHRPPGPPDRDVRPFDGTLGRPCAYRERFTPSGTRRVRVCF